MKISVNGTRYIVRTPVCIVEMVVSSAYKLIVQLITTVGRSFRNTRNRSGLRIEPCGIPTETEIHSE